MDFFARHDLNELLEFPTDQEGDVACVSLYMPAHRTGRETRQDLTRFKNLRVEASRRLEDAGMKRVEVGHLLAAVERLEVDASFWLHQSDGLAVFAGQGFNRVYRLPLEFPELVVVNDRFHVKPLLPLLQSDGRFYVLAVSQNRVRLFQTTQHHLDEIENNRLPTRLADVSGDDDADERLQFHSHREGGAAPDDQATFHGHDPSDDEKKGLLRFFQHLDTALQDVLRDERAPLVFAGVDYLFPIFQQACDYANLLEQHVSGNFDTAAPEELHRQAWDVVRPVFEQHHQQTVTEYHDLRAKGLSSDNVTEVLAAACQGAVKTLLVACGQHVWGTFDPIRLAAEQHDERTADSEDLLDLAATDVLRHGGDAYVLDAKLMPSDAPMAATFRYAPATAAAAPEELVEESMSK